jgi:hypothetical protein
VFGDDYRAQAEAAAMAIFDAGYLDKTGVLGPPEPPATTIRRIIRDLEAEALRRDPARHLGQSVDDIVGARVLREYAERLRKHPAIVERATTEADRG